MRLQPQKEPQLSLTDPGQRCRKLVQTKQGHLGGDQKLGLDLDEMRSAETKMRSAETEMRPRPAASIVLLKVPRRDRKVKKSHKVNQD